MIKNKSLNKFRERKLVHKPIREVMPGDIVCICPDSSLPAKWVEIEEAKDMGSLIELHFQHDNHECKILLWGCNFHQVNAII